MRVQLFVSPKFAKEVALTLTVIVAGFVGLSLVAEAFNAITEVGGTDGDIELFSLDADQNVPTWYSSSMLLVCSSLLATIAVASVTDVYKLHWAALSIIFLYLSADEAASIHEKAGLLLASLVNTGSFSHYLWVILYGPLVFIFVLVYMGFVRQLPTRTRRLFFIAGFLYVGGALGTEVVGGLYAVSYGRSSLGYFLFTQVEEILEMLGVVVFLYALLLYVSSYVSELSLGSRDRTGP